MFAHALTALVLAGAAIAQTFSINTPPSIQQCQPVALSWVGGTAPFIIAAIPESQVTAPALATIAEGVTASPYTWTPNLATGTAITIRITDSLGNIAYSSGRTIQAGGTGCLTSSVSGSGAAAPTVSGSSAQASVSSVSSALSVSRASSAAATTSSAAATTSSSSAAAATTSSSSSAAPTTSRPATSTAAASSAAAGFAKVSFNAPVLAIAAALGCAALGGFALLA